MVTLLGICSVLFVIINITNADSPNTLTIDDFPSLKRCGLQSPDKIAGGVQTAINEYPWMALLHYTKANGQGGFFCSGTLINENYVLTVARCIHGLEKLHNPYVLDSVRLGEHDLRTDPDCEEGECADPVVDIPIAETIVHENYNSTSKSHGNEIALIRLQRPAPYTDYIRPICLPIKDLQNKVYDELPMVTVGFGRTENSTQSQIKLKVEVNGFSLDQCSNIYRQFSINLSDEHLCAGGEEGKGSCNGDSGGPLMAEHVVDGDVNMYLAGIVSFGARMCGTPGIPDVYTRVGHYIDWIVEHMKK